MRKSIDLISVGKTLKSFGVKGEIKVDIDDLFEDYILESKVLFLNVDGNDVPYFIEQHREIDTLVLTFKDVYNPEQVHMLQNKNISIDKNNLPLEIISKWEQSHIDQNLSNYNIFDLNSNIKVKIRSIEEYPGQMIAIVDYQSDIKTIPLNEDLIKNINHKEKLITMQLPEGIFDL